MTLDTDSKILEKLEEQKRIEGPLPALLELYQNLLQIQVKAKKRIKIVLPDLSGEIVERKIAKGAPLLRFGDLTLDWALLREVFSQVVEAMAEYPAFTEKIPETLRGPKAGRLLTKKAVKAWYEGGEMPPSPLAQEMDPGLLQAAIATTLKPFLTGYALELVSMVDPEQWLRHYCPVCGGAPDFSYLGGEHGMRYLVCSRCDTEWQYRRLVCPYCLNEDQKQLGFYTDDDSRYRLYFCDKCKRYLKAIDLRKLGDVLLPLERFYNTLDMDRQAQERGYLPPDSSVGR